MLPQCSGLHSPVRNRQQSLYKVEKLIAAAASLFQQKYAVEWEQCDYLHSSNARSGPRHKTCTKCIYLELPYFPALSLMPPVEVLIHCISGKMWQPFNIKEPGFVRMLQTICYTYIADIAILLCTVALSHLQKLRWSSEKISLQ